MESRTLGNLNQNLWTVKEVADYLRVSSSWVYKEASADRLPVRHMGAMLRFVPSEIEAFALGNWQPKTLKTGLRHRRAR